MLLAFLIAVACEAGAFDVEPEGVVESITLDLTEAELVSGRSLVVEADLRDAAGNSVSGGVGGATIEWSSSDDRIAFITPLGPKTARVTGYAAGTASITATVQQTTLQAGFLALQQGPPPGRGPQASGSVHVRPANLVYVAGSDQSGTVGTTLPQELVVQAIDDSANGVPNVEITFAPVGSSGTLEPATVVTGEDGLARSRWTLGDQAGTLKAEAKGHNRLKLPTIEFTATAVASEGGGSEPASVEVTPKSATLNAVGDTLHLAAVVRDADGNQLPDSNVSWSSKNSSIATVDSTGTVVAIKAGRVPIVAGVETVLDSSVVDVDQVAASVTVSPDGATLTEGDSKQFAATVEDSNGVALTDPSLTWSSSNTSVATVDAAGVVTANQAGSTNLTATSKGASGMASITVEASSATPPPPSGMIPAFPGAEGWGATALNACRSLPLVVHKVTNTNDSGTGSLRDILENRVSNSAYDVVIFRTGGTITVSSVILLNRDCVHVAGQTAPGDGIMIRSAGQDSDLIRIVANNPRGNIVFRYLRLRHGFPTAERGGGLLATGDGGANNIVFDHLSVSWAGGSGHLSVNRVDPAGANTERISFQNNIVAEGIESRGVMVFGNSNGSAFGIRDVSVHRNLMASLGQRVPRLHAGDADVSTSRGAEVVNNVTFNHYNRVVVSRWRSVVDWVGNYHYEPDNGWSGSNMNRWEAEVIGDALDPNDTGSLYINGNATPGYGGSEWSFWRQWGPYTELPASMRRTTRMALPPFPIAEMSATDARAWVLANAGANKRLAEDGTWLHARDAVDARIVAYVERLDSPGDLRRLTVEQIHGSWPVYAAGTPPTDADGDGLPDAWERRFYDCNTCAEPAGRTDSGYFLIEHYLNGTNP